MTIDAVAQRFPEASSSLGRRDTGFAPEGGEDILSYQARITTCFHDLHAVHRGNDILLVTHGGVLDIIARTALGLPLETQRTFSLYNGAINIVALKGTKWEFHTWGDVSHLKRVDARDDITT